ncbi:hypothetical protein IJH72_00550 [Candidatus Saccharibacteria bacterium]|nr:hypothetical protein [Candidatus Saccharibacteria bacterium]
MFDVATDKQQHEHGQLGDDYPDSLNRSEIPKDQGVEHGCDEYANTDTPDDHGNSSLMYSPYTLYYSTSGLICQ